MSLPPELNAFTGRLLAVRNSQTSLASDVSRGISEVTERYAFAYTVPATADLHRPEMITGATRALGMIAKYKRTPNSTLPLGRNFASIPGVTPGPNDGVSERLSLVVDLDIEQAAQIIEGLVGRATAVNFYALVELLTFWDTGDLERDLKTRSRLIYDFYSRPDYTTKKAS
ncbi:hypothetical protein E3T28_10850 [Cryobacterium sinapicolor]|uniref:Type I-E CRISPR-associated protein Cse2/CasB n=1 Tax=Cryobacterium sinapicolor TaxID=1259236 RepID=A0ABY2J0Q0_9MICO|nr:hypothetical protein [Cryobacterium sinapicolor]TFC98529.1 hypothetical protein E3T28_10850 [Cryobacterium sinapicolor]